MEGGQQRNPANFHPSVWGGDHFLVHHSDSYSLGRDDLIVKVRSVLHHKAGDNTLALLELIDQVQRFGIAYHFKEEIGSLLSKLSESYPNLTQGSRSDDDLYMVSLLFRLLRQQGHRVSSDVFDVFKDPATGKFRESLAGNVLGVLSLFEAGHMLVPGDVILEEALAYASTHLESVKEERETPFIGKLVKHGLKQPLRQGYPRVEAWRYIHIYQDDASCNESVLALAKSDFNYLQKLHHKEASDVVRWWKERDFVGHMPFVRDRIVECYLWILSVYFEPEFSFARVFLAKTLAMTSLMDDMFDAYGTLEEKELFTEALERWDISSTEGLPEYIKFYYRALMDVYSEIEEELVHRGHSYRLGYAKRLMNKQARAYLAEARWLDQKFIPPIDEYMATASMSIGLQMLAMHSLVGMGDLVMEDTFEWLSSNPRVLKSTAAASRFINDIMGYKFEHERGHVASSIHCLMKQYGCTEHQAEDMLRKWIFDSWKDVNEACLMPLPAPMPVLERILNWLRSTSLFYDGIDNYTHSTTKLKDIVTAILIDPLPL